MNSFQKQQDSCFVGCGGKEALISIIIKNNRTVWKIYDADSFLEMPLKNVRKLWMYMFDEAWNNEETITNLKQWLLNTNARLSMEAEINESEFAQAVHNAEEARRVKEAHGSVATKEINQAAQLARKNAKTAENRFKQSKRDCIKISKLQSIFDEMYKKFL